MNAIQETHIHSENQLRSRGKISGYDLIWATYHHAYGVARYVQSKIENVFLLSASSADGIHEVAIKVGKITVINININKPPAIMWQPQVVQAHPRPAVYFGISTVIMNSGGTGRMTLTVRHSLSDKQPAIKSILTSALAGFRFLLNTTKASSLH